MSRWHEMLNDWESANDYVFTRKELIRLLDFELISQPTLRILSELRWERLKPHEEKHPYQRIPDIDFSVAEILKLKQCVEGK